VVFFYSFIIKIFFKHTNIYNNNPLVLNTWGLLLYMLIKKKVMDNKTLKNIFNFIEINEGKKTPFVWKLINNDPFTEDDLYIKGDLDLSYITNVFSLPNGLKIEGDLDVAYSFVELPKGLQVGGNLFVDGTYLEDYNKAQIEEMIYPGFIKGNVIYEFKLEI